MINLPTITIRKGLLIILLSAVISTILANTVDMTHYELGALINLLWPPILGILSLIVFLVICLIFKSPVVRLITLTVISLYLLYVGIALHLEKDYWPFVI